jgi:glutamate/aspartate transport system substrate-binding protein
METTMRPFINQLLCSLAAVVFAMPLVATAGPTMDKIKTQKSIALGYRDTSVPFSYVGNDGKPWGYSVELCTKVVEAIKTQLKLDTLNVKWVMVQPSDRLEKVVKGDVDLECGSTTASLARMEKVDFSLMTFADGGGYITASDKVNSLADLKGRKLGVAAGTTTERTLRAALDKKQLDTELVIVKDHSDGIAAMSAGKVDAYASDRALLAGLILGSGNKSAWRLGSELFSYEPYALMMRRDDPDFRLAVNRELARLYRSREIYDIYERWFGAISKVGPLLDNLYFLNGLPE